MNQSRMGIRFKLALACLITASTVQLGCRSETSQPEIAKVAKATADTVKVKKAIMPPTDPGAKTEVSADPPPPFVNAHFEAPFRLMVDNNPLNTDAKQMYPSPAIYDVDNDGQPELVVGDIFGGLNVYENKSDGHGDPIWNKHYALKTADGDAIKVSNW